MPTILGDTASEEFVPPESESRQVRATRCTRGVKMDNWYIICNGALGYYGEREEASHKRRVE